MNQGRGDCVEWTGQSNGTYGTINSAASGKRLYVHRVMYEAAHGPLGEGLIVRHKCDNPKCVNPTHLESGTYADNTRDMMDRGRGINRLTVRERKLARKMYREGGTFVSVGSHLGVSPETIRRACADLRPGQGRCVRKLTWEQREDIVRRYLSGERRVDLAREFGVTDNAITHHVQMATREGDR